MGAEKPNALAKLVPAVEAGTEAPNRVKNAKELRKIYIDIMRSPDGTEPLPLTLPKCVECAHCGWPVDPRGSRVATRKTYARAGIERGNRDPQKEIKKQEEEGLPTDEEAAAAEDDDDDLDPLEKAMDKIDELMDENSDLKRRVEDLEHENKKLTEELEATKAALEAAEEKIEMLEAAELRWRQKLTQAKGECARLTQVLERSGMVSADRERGLVDALTELRRVNNEYAAYRRRRGWMLGKVGETHLRERQKEELVAQALRLWRPIALKQKLARQLEELELRRQREVAELKQQLDAELTRRRALEANVSRLEGRLKAAAHRLLQRSLRCDAHPGGPSNWFRAWVGLTPLLACEAELEITQEDLQDTQNKLDNQTSRAEGAEGELAKTREELAADKADLEKARAELKFLEEEQGLSRDALEAKAKAEAEREQMWKDLVAEGEQKLVDAEARFDEERNGLEAEIKVLEGKLMLAESMGGEGGGGGPAIDEAACVVPKGQGVLCVGCLKQLVHRTVKPLSPRSAMRASPELLAEARRRFFEEEMKGLASGDDQLHNYVFNARKDPYAINRLTLLPRTHVIPPAPPTRSPSSPTFGATSPGLPSLKRTGVMRKSMGEFRPRGFGSSAVR